MKNCVSTNDFLETVLSGIKSLLNVKTSLVLPSYKADINKEKLKKNYRETGEGIGIKNIQRFVDIKSELLKKVAVVHELLAALKQFCDDAQSLNEQVQVDVKKT